jgi:hypothetical protein
MSESESRLLACQIRHASLSASALVAEPEALDVQPLGGGVADQAHVVRPRHAEDAAELVAGLRGQPRQRVVAGVVVVEELDLVTRATICL